MAHGTARKLTRAATLSLLVFATTSGVAGIEVLAASPAMAQPDQGSPFAPGQQQQPSDPSPGNGSNPGQGQQPGGPADGLTGIIGSALGGNGTPGH